MGGFGRWLLALTLGGCSFDATVSQEAAVGWAADAYCDWIYCGGEERPNIERLLSICHDAVVSNECPDGCSWPMEPGMGACIEALELRADTCAPGVSSAGTPEECDLFMPETRRRRPDEPWPSPPT
jgi:hypothetical protein